MPDKNQIAERLKDAYETVKGAELPEHLEPEGLRLAFDALVGDDTGRAKGKSRTKRERPKEAPEPEAEQVTEEGFFQTLAQNSELPEATLREVFYLRDGKVGLDLRGPDLGNNMKSRVISLTTLLAGAYRLGMGQPLSDETAREVAGAYQSWDTNFSKNVRANPNVTYSGPRRGAKTIDLRAGSEEAFDEMVREVTGQAE